MYSTYTVHHTIVKVVLFSRPQVVLKILFFQRLLSTSSQLELDEDPDLKFQMFEPGSHLTFGGIFVDAHT